VALDAPRGLDDDRREFDVDTEDGPELELSDEDILDAMRDVPGYVDISTQDFRTIYHLAHGHALERLFRHVSARNLMRTGIAPLHPDTKLDATARALVAQGLKGLPASMSASG
jgi:CBS-domain-containing membrane protein